MASLLQFACSVLLLSNVIPFAFGTKFLLQLDHTVHKIHYIFTAVTVFTKSIYYVFMPLSRRDSLYPRIIHVDS